MNCYVTITGAVFGLVAVAHIWRMFLEPHLAKEPWFLLMTAASAALCLWAVRLVLRSRREVR